MSGVICDRRVKGQVSKMVARPAKMYGLETMVLTRRQVAELKIRGFLMRVWAGLEMSVSEGAV